MSQENAEIVREMYEAFNRGDWVLAREMLHPDAELTSRPRHRTLPPTMAGESGNEVS